MPLFSMNLVTLGGQGKVCTSLLTCNIIPVGKTTPEMLAGLAVPFSMKLSVRHQTAN